MSTPRPDTQRAPWREKLRVVIFEAAVSARSSDRTCAECASAGHVDSARFCKDCGVRLQPSVEGESG